MNTHWPPPLDLYGLGLLRMIAEHGNLTRAAAAAGLTQSALTRQLQGIEQRLGVEIFERSTRQIRLTAAGTSLLKDTAAVQSLMDGALRRLDMDHLSQPREVRIGVSRSIAFAHLPGLLHAHLRRAPDVKTSVEHVSSSDLLARLEAGDLDVGVLCPPRRLPPGVRVTHRMEDAFQFIMPARSPLPGFEWNPKSWSPRLRSYLESQAWLTINPSTRTGTRLRQWLVAQGLNPAPAMEPDSFDLIMHLVALGMGVAMVPRRAIAAFPRRKLLRAMPLPEEFRRELAVIVPRKGRTPAHVTEFVDSILFS